MALITPPKVTLLNPEVVKQTRELVGGFASICKEAGDCVVSSVRNKRIGEHCISSGHMSPCRHIYWMFRVEYISRVCSHQLVRHHVGVAVNQLSGVFTETSIESGNHYIIPQSVENLIHDGNPDNELLKEYTDLINKIESFTKHLRDAGVSNSDARYFVPNGVNTAMNIAMTPEALFHIANERLCSKAQWEIRAVVREMVKAVIAQDPWFKDYLVPKCVKLNGCNEKLSCGFYTRYLNTRLPLHGDVISKPIEDRIKVHRCSKCGIMVQFKEDDPVPGTMVDNVFTCRQCSQGG